MTHVQGRAILAMQWLADTHVISDPCLTDLLVEVDDARIHSSPNWQAIMSLR